MYERYQACKFCPGQIQLVQVAPGLWVCNLAGQDGFGRDQRYTDYDALCTAFPKLNTWASKRNLSIAIPFHMGCANAGGDWDVVKQIITASLTQCDVTIYSKRR